MSYQYGILRWGTINAPEIFSGELMSYRFRKLLQEQLEEDAAGENMALILDRPRGELDFEVKITNDSTNFVNLASGAAIAVSGEADLTGGVVLCESAVEEWAIGRAKMATVRAIHYPDVVQASPASVGTLNAFTPSQAGLNIVTPANKIVYGTYGLGHASGIPQSLRLEQRWQLSDGEPTPDGRIVGVLASGYQRRITLEMLSTGGLPVVGATLTITGAPAHAANYKITNAEKMYRTRTAERYRVEALWLPLF
jgi:hypothetical protein